MIVQGRATSDGAGVQLTRVIGHSLQQRMDPFLMLDAFGSPERSDYQGGFPDHPHRGFETLTYLLAGRMRHHDSAGHEGLLEAGGIQWMSAGRGVIHSEMPEQEEGRLEGFQLWINLPAKDKLSVPAYREVAQNDIPSWISPQGTPIAILMGALMEVDGAIQRPLTEPLVLDIKMEAGVTEWIPLNAEHHGGWHRARSRPADSPGDGHTGARLHGRRGVPHGRRTKSGPFNSRQAPSRTHRSTGAFCDEYDP